MNIDYDKLMYLLIDFEDTINCLINSVLIDSKEDPHFSAVATANRIKCYMTVMQQLGEEMPYSTVKEYFGFNGFTDGEYISFEEKRQKESTYYSGVQY